MKEKLEEVILILKGAEDPAAIAWAIGELELLANELGRG